jgi:hypothetical protein
VDELGNCGVGALAWPGGVKYFSPVGVCMGAATGQ